jgi:hypothetical protein
MKNGVASPSVVVTVSPTLLGEQAGAGSEAGGPNGQRQSPDEPRAQSHNGTPIEAL